MELKPIRTEADYDAALRAVSPYFDNEPEPGSPDADRFEILVMLIEAYETKHYWISPPDPVEAIKFRMEQAGLTAKDLEPMIGRMNRVYEVLTRKRPLTLPMIVVCMQAWEFPRKALSLSLLAPSKCEQFIKVASG